ncbi:MAG: metallophosphoesterase family protein [Acidobacteriota bacterium]|nr:metallophosphoesterase family protein [Acidobacteriota bacterium]
MKLLLFSDLHRDLEATERLVRLSVQADVAVSAGDLATIHQGLHEIVAVLERMACPTVLVPGNGETFEELSEACSSWRDAHVLHGTAAQIEGQSFFGLGGGVPVTPFGSWSYDFTEEEAASLLAECPADAVLVSHSPPKGTVDQDAKGKSLGSQAVRDVILESRPALVVCGHIHHCAGQHEQLGSSTVINAGPRGVLWELEP